MKCLKRPEHFLWILASVLLFQIPFAPLSVSAQELPVDSAFSQTIDSIFSESDSKSGDEICEEISELKNEETVLTETGRSDSGVLSGLIQNYETEKAAFFLGGNVSMSDSIQTEWNREKQYMLFGFSGNETFLQFLPKYEITDLSSSGPETAVSIYEWMTVKYRDTPDSADSVSGYGYTFTLHIRSDQTETKSDSNTPVQSGSFAIVSVSDTEANYEELESEGVFITASGITYQEDETASSEAESSGDEALVGAGTLNVSWVYDVDDAAAYADKWANSQNTDYTWWGGRGGDCANFVSQCLYTGGFPKTSAWYPDSGSWIGQNELRSYLNQIGAGKLITAPTDKDLQKGDLVWYNWDGKGSSTNHITICVGKDSSGVPLIDSHTAARKRVKWNYGGENATYLAMQMKVSSSDNVPVYRLYNRNSGEHFYTAGTKERDYLQKQGWSYEGIGWTAVSSKTSGAASVYRLYNANSGEHFYTASAKEYNYLKTHGWKGEGVLCRTVKKSSHPLYRLYNPNAKTASHHYTKSKKEADYLKKIGWKNEGIAWYSK